MSLSSQQKYDNFDKNELYDLLSSHRRRYVIYYCRQADDPPTLSDLAEQIAAWEQEKELTEITSAERKRVYTSLQQTHLDRLEQADLIEFDDDMITLTDEARQLDVYLDIVPSNSIPWGVYYLGLCGLSAVILAGLWIEFIPTETLPVLGWVSLILLVFTLSAVAQTLQNRRYQLDRFEKPP